MSVACPRAENSLTKADRRIFSFLAARADSEPTASTRHLAEDLKLSRSTVQASIARLNDFEWIQTLTGTPTKPSVHKILKPGEAVQVPVVGGPILPEGVEKGGGPISPESVENHLGGGPILGQGGGPILPTNPQPGGPILWKNGADFHSASTIRARDTDTTLTTRTVVSESTDTRGLWISGEVAQFAAVLCGRESLDWKLAQDFEGLASKFQLPSGVVAEFVTNKYLEKRNSRYRLAGPGALYKFVEEDLGLWAHSEQGRARVQHWRWFTGLESKPMQAERGMARAAGAGR